MPTSATVVGGATLISRSFAAAVVPPPHAQHMLPATKSVPSFQVVGQLAPKASSYLESYHVQSLLYVSVLPLLVLTHVWALALEYSSLSKK